MGVAQTNVKKALQGLKNRKAMTPAAIDAAKTAEAAEQLERRSLAAERQATALGHLAAAVERTNGLLERVAIAAERTTQAVNTLIGHYKVVISSLISPL